MKTRIFRYLLSVFLGFVLIYFYNSSRWPNRSAKQIKFEQWLNSVQAQQELDSQTNQLIKIDYLSIEKKPSFTINSKFSIKNVLRILELVKESNVLSSDPMENKKTIQLKISGSENFSANINHQQILKNPKLALLMKLLQVYSEEEKLTKNSLEN